MARVCLSPGVYKDEHGEIYVNENELPGARNVAGVGADYDDFGDDPEWGIDEADNAFGEDDAAAMAYLSGEVGRTRNPRRQAALKSRYTRRANKLERKAARKGVDLDIGREPEDHVKWMSTAVSGATPASSSGTQTATIRLQHDFRSEDLRAVGLSGSKVKEIRFGDKTIWSSATGIDISLLGANSFMTGVIKGNTCPAGLDITITAELPSSGQVEFSLFGTKPSTC